ncbi:MAG: hypothetical protein WA821_21710 [Anaerolineales bacterium]
MRMKKWVVRGLGILFLVWASVYVFALLTDQQSKTGLFGFYFQIANINITGWIAGGMLLYTGYHLIRLQEGGRFFALVFLWLSLIQLSLALILGIYYVIRDPQRVSPGQITFAYGGETHIINDVFIVYSIVGLLGMFLVLAISFLSSKDTKTLFAKSSENTETA